MLKLHRLKDSSPVDITSLLAKGDSQFEQKNYHDALFNLNEILIINPQHISALKLRSKVYIELGDVEKVLIDLNTILFYEPHHFEALEYRSSVFLNYDQQDDLLTDYNTMLLLVPFHYKTLSSRFYLYIKQNKLDEALIDLNDLLISKPNSIEFLLSRIDINTKKDRMDRVLIDVMTLFELGEEVNGLLQRAAAYYRLGRYDESLVDLNALLPKIIFNKSYAYHTRTALDIRMKICCFQNKLDNARLDVTSLIESLKGKYNYLHTFKTLKVELIAALIFRAGIYLQQNNLTQAITDLNMVLNETSEHREALTLRLEAYKIIDNERDAVLDEYALYELDLKEGKVPSLTQFCKMAFFKQESIIESRGDAFKISVCETRKYLAFNGINRTTLESMQSRFRPDLLLTKKTVFDQLDDIETALLAEVQRD